MDGIALRFACNAIIHRFQRDGGEPSHAFFSECNVGRRVVEVLDDDDVFGVEVKGNLRRGGELDAEGGEERLAQRVELFAGEVVEVSRLIPNLESLEVLRVKGDFVLEVFGEMARDEDGLPDIERLH